MEREDHFPGAANHVHGIHPLVEDLAGLRLGRAELFLQPEIINVMNETAQFIGTNTVYTVQNDDTLSPFNPFTETPVEGVHYRFDENFGKARNANDYQLARTYRFSFGLRF